MTQDRWPANGGKGTCFAQVRTPVLSFALWFTTTCSRVAQLVKHLRAMRETWVQFLGQEDPLEKEMATHSSVLAWRIPWTEEPGGLQFMELQESNTA